MKRGIVLLLCFIQLMLISSAFAQTVKITNGLNYLSSTQNPDGSWTSDTTEVLPTTVSIIETLQTFNETSSQNYFNAVTWLQSQNLETTDYLAGRIHALSTSGTDLDLALSYVDGVYTGAWCGYKDFEVNILDTALIISALKKINHPDLDTISNALFYLTYNQNADGGFGSYAGDDSSVYMTAVNLNALISYSDVFDLQSEINNAVAYLLTKQNPDGSFPSTGSGQGTVYETALAFIALIESPSTGSGQAQSSTSSGLAQAVQNAIAYLLSTQLPNGSWNDDPYSTALALRALYIASSERPLPTDMAGSDSLEKIARSYSCPAPISVEIHKNTDKYP